MPYIKDENGRRKELRDGDVAKNAGELNYQIFSYIDQFQEEENYSDIQIIRYVNKFVGCKPNYQKYNDMVGCLNCCYVEVLRRMHITAKILHKIIDMYQEEIALYEDKKIQENGDV